MKNLNLITLANCEEFISLTLRTRNSKKPSIMLARNWEHKWLPQCLARSARTIKIVGLVINPIRPKQDLRVFLEASECTRLRMGESLPNHHEDHIAGKRRQFTAALQVGSQIYSCAPSHENSRSKGSSGQGTDKIGKDSGVGPDKSQK